jgi:toxin-antitoxin system PIN domain toxin
MKSCLVDINVMVALLAGHHLQHALARKWFAGCGQGEIGICRYVQLGIIRLLGYPQVMGRSAISGFAAFRLIHELTELDERVEFINEAPGVDSYFPQLLSNQMPASKAVNDAYLAACAIAANRRLVTFDAGFRNFKSLDLALLETAG